MGATLVIYHGVNVIKHQVTEPKAYVKKKNRSDAIYNLPMNKHISSFTPTKL